jgi:hypothetical protein
LKTPSDAQNHGSSHRNVGRSYSKKMHQNVRKGRSGGGTSIESSSGNTTFMDLSSSDTRSSVPKKKRKRHSQSYLIEEFNKDKSPTFDGEIKKGEEAETWLLDMKKYFRVHN